jgi:mannan endo-1,4-beta-mannosidase
MAWVSKSAAVQPLVLPQPRGYISVAPGGRYFQDEQGRGFIVIGQNDAISWPGLNSLLDRTSLETTEDYVKDLRANGINVSRVMIEYAQYEFSLFENPIGVFSPSVVQFWDEFIALAEKHGLYLLLTPYDTFWQVHNWKTYPYNAAVGGPCQSMRDWLTDPATLVAQKARWDFMITRWGGSPNILAWDLMNETDLYWGCTPDEISGYLTEMATYVRDLEQRRWGKTHLLTVSAAAPVPDGALGDVIYNHPQLDFATTHLYVGFGVREPDDTVEGAVNTIEGVRLSLQSIRKPRPYLDSESGPIDRWVEDVAFDTEYHHNITWAHLASGAAGSGMRWPYTQPHYLLPELRRNLRAVARFAASVDWAHFVPRCITSDIGVDRGGFIKTGCADRDMALLWLLADTRLPHPPTLDGLTVRVAFPFHDGPYSIELWDTYAGEPLAEYIVEVRLDRLKFTLPRFDRPLRDLAIVARRVG